MSYKYLHATGKIYDDEDGQVVAEMSDSATREQGLLLAASADMLKSLEDSREFILRFDEQSDEEIEFSRKLSSMIAKAKGE